MLANVVIGAQLIFAIAQNQNAFVANVDYQAITDFVEFFTDASKAPIRAVDLLHFAVEDFGRVVFFAVKTFAEPVDFFFGHLVFHPKPVGISS